MEAIYKKRLLNVARALRESPKPKAFTMRFYVRGNEGDCDDTSHNWCGTPACALGHYAARTDLQRLMRILNGEAVYRESINGYGICYADACVVKHFGIYWSEADRLFGPEGCGNAKTTKQAARYIERFVARKEKEDVKGKR